MAKTIGDITSDAYDGYQDFLKQNVDVIGEIETALKWLSYFVAGQGSKTASLVLSELVYSASNVLSLFNDSIIRRHVIVDDDDDNDNDASDAGNIGSRPHSKSAQCEFVRMTLTLIDYLEVFAEISSDRLWGTKGKWLIITVIQICKAAMRLFLLLKQRCGILTTPAVPPLTIKQRKNAFQRLQRSDQLELESDPAKASKIQMTFTLKRSGRVVRTLSSSPPVVGRTWKLPTLLKNREAGSADIQPFVQTELNRIQILGEALHAVRPLVHLLARLSLGQQSWAQWLLACGMDVASLRLLGNQPQFDAREISELRYRSIVMLHYLIRSPFYETFTKERLNRLMGGISNRVPLARFICNPAMDYLPTWQSVYFYSWGS